jgi:hypothetical protein
LLMRILNSQKIPPSLSSFLILALLPKVMITFDCYQFSSFSLPNQNYLKLQNEVKRPAHFNPSCLNAPMQPFVLARS